MNQQLKTVLLTVLTLSCFVIALVELSGVSKTALVNKFHINEHNSSSIGPMGEVSQNEAKARSMAKTQLTFTETKHSFGTIKEGDVVKYAYHFKNTGTNPLLIYNAVASCGCTVPSYPKEPIAPGAEGDIEVEFNSHNRVGHQKKNVLVYSNAEQEAMSIGFDVEVVKK